MSNEQNTVQQQSTEDKERPVDTLRDGPLKASIWKNETERGAAFNTTFSRVYQTEQGAWAESKSIPSKELLRLSELGRAAHHRVGELRRQHLERKASSHSRTQKQEQER